MRNGIISAGNWVIDKVKILDVLPERGMLGSILTETTGTGGAPYNVLIDLAQMKAKFPLYGAGIIGADENGDFILRDLKEHSINSKYIRQTKDAPTSYTDVMTEKATGARTFFHCRGANALLDIEDFEKIDVPARIFHLGYLLLLDKLDVPDEEYGVKSARVLSLLQNKGYKTSVDVVSESGDRFQKLVTPALKYIDYLIINEIEAERITSNKIRTENSIDAYNLKTAALMLMEKGVRERVVIHFPEGGYSLDNKSNEVFVPSFLVDSSEIKGTVGAGDAFCAGMLYALHEEIDIADALKLASANARFNLLHPTSTGGAVPVDEVLDYMNKAKLRPSII